MCLSFVEYLGSQSLHYGANTLFWHSPERQKLFSSDHTEILKYKLFDEYWVCTLLQFLGSAVALDHTVVKISDCVFCLFEFLCVFPRYIT